MLRSATILYETADDRLLASEHRQISTLDRSVAPNHSLVPAQYALISAAPVQIPIDEMASQNPLEVVFRYEQLLLAACEHFVSVNDHQLDVPFYLDQYDRPYLPIKALSSALLISHNTENGFSCRWNEHEVTIHCENGYLMQVYFDGQPLPMQKDLLFICMDNEIYASTEFFTLLGYERNGNNLVLSVQ